MGIKMVLRCGCGLVAHIYTGSGMLSPEQRSDIMADMLAGKYGKQRREFCLRNPLATVSGARRLYVCPDCGSWRVETSLDLYLSEEDVPADDSAPALPYNHRCSRCKKTMKAVSDLASPDRPRLRCPECCDILV